MTTLLFVSGSQRRESFNSRLLQHLAQRLDGRCEIDLLQAAQVDLPLFDQDIEGSPEVMGRVASLHQRFKACHGIVVSSPEYNGQPTPYLKNLVDWVSRLAHVDTVFDNPFLDRPLLLCSASTGWSGGAVGLTHARALFGYVGCVVMGEAICVPYVEQAWTGDRYDFDLFFDDQIRSTTDRFLQLAQACEPGFGRENAK